jgi:D-amino-acid oxidase
MHAVVIGAGVSGLTTGVCLAEAGLSVTIRTAAPPEQTTSIAAGALWGPVRIGPQDRVLGWARHSLDILTKLAAEPGTGVRMVTGQEVTRTGPELPYWSPLVPDMRFSDPAELQPGFAGGWHYTAPLATMPVYLGYLQDRFERAGGTVEFAPVTSLSGAPVVVNCTGFAARDLVPDPQVYPVRGQVVIAQNPGIEEFLISRDEPEPRTVYMFPHGDTILLGGTVEAGEEDLTPKPEISERIVADACSIEPRLRGVAILGHRVGLRPCRPEVRLESEQVDGTLVWHNYGHGGAGISVSWGCAAEITAALTAPLPPPLPNADDCDNHPVLCGWLSQRSEGGSYIKTVMSAKSNVTDSGLKYSWDTVPR